MKVFTAEELAQCNGKIKNKCYVAYKGLVYDVTESYHWRNGEHWIIHKAGCDLTKEMEEAPHFDNLLHRFKVVGKLLK